ncbi:MAG TPA: glycosyltransferase [Terriglobales bacterium]|nr:glycosyltransferase [Terriglobales bacterium]
MIDGVPFNRLHNTGILKSTLFQGWPKECLRQIIYVHLKPGFDVCEHNWQLNKTDVLKAMFGPGPDRRLAIETPQEATLDSEKLLDHDTRPKGERALSWLSAEIRTPVGEAILRLPGVLSLQLRAWIEEFQPEVIYSITASAAMLRLVTKVAEWRKIPIVPHFTDDWISWLYRDDLFGWWLRPSLLYWFERCLDRSPVRLAVSRRMADEYTDRYGGTFSVFTNPHEMPLTRPRPAVKPADSPAKLVFVGGLRPGREKTLLTVARAVSDARKAGVACELDIYSFPEDLTPCQETLAANDGVRVMGWAKPGAVAAILQGADVMVHVESFEKAMIEKTRLSFSTKISAYLAAAKPILVCGPGTLASCDLVATSGSGISVPKDSVEQVSAAIQSLCLNADLRARLGDRSWQVAISEFEAGTVRENFRRNLCYVAASGAS